MKSAIIAFTSLITGIIATEGTFHPPKAKPFLDIDFFVGWPVNATTPHGLVAVTSNAAGAVTGHFNGELVGNTTASVERFMPSGTGPGEYSEYANDLLLAIKDEGNVLAKMNGIASYANGGLHGFAHVRFETTIPHLKWISYGMFVAEWVGSTNSGTGNAKVQIFEISSGGRKDGQRIPAIEVSETSD